MKSKYDAPERIRWYNTLWDMRKKDFRNIYIKAKRRDWRLFLKYESHLIYERVFIGFAVASTLFFLCNTNFVLAMFRLPTEDVNELLKQDVWQKYRNEINERKDHASKILEESSYVQNKNKPFSG